MDGRLFSSRETIFFLIERTRKTLKKLLQHSGLKFLSSGRTFCTTPHSASYEAFFGGFDFTCTTKTHNLRTLALSKCSIVYSILQLAKECLQRNVQVTISVLENALKHTERTKASRLLSRLLGINRALKSASRFLSCDEWKSLAAVLLNLGMKIALQFQLLWAISGHQLLCKSTPDCHGRPQCSRLFTCPQRDIRDALSFGIWA